MSISGSARSWALGTVGQKAWQRCAAWNVWREDWAQCHGAMRRTTWRTEGSMMPPVDTRYLTMDTMSPVGGTRVTTLHARWTRLPPGMQGTA